jgi:pimeloyl-ACP methyl ester carboxylesterase
MPYFETKDDTRLFYRDWGTGKPVVFCAGWNLSSDMWRSQMLALSDAGLRCVAYDRRGQGLSDDPGTGYDYDTLSDDLDALLTDLDLESVCLVAHSMAGGEVIRYLTRHGSQRVERAVLLSSVSPLALAGPENPDGFDPALVDAVRDLWRADFSQWIEDGADAYFATQFLENTVSTEDVAWTFRDMQRASFRAAFDLNQAQMDADWREEMRSITIPILLIHGDADASSPIALSSRQSVKLIAGSRLEVYENAGHGLYVTHRGRLSSDLLKFCAVEALECSSPSASNPGP